MLVFFSVLLEAAWKGPFIPAVGNKRCGRQKSTEIKDLSVAESTVGHVFVTGQRLAVILSIFLHLLGHAW